MYYEETVTVDKFETVDSKLKYNTSFNSIIIVNDESAQTDRLIWFLKTIVQYETPLRKRPRLLLYTISATHPTHFNTF